MEPDAEHLHDAGGRGAGRGVRPWFAAPRGVREWAAAALVSALYVAARLWRLDAACLWFDEIFGLHAARHGWDELPRFVALDLIHPPLFYLLLKVWAALGGESVWWLRLFSVAASALAVVPVVLLGRELRLGRRAVLLALVLAASSGYLIKYAQEVRMYSPLLLCAASSLWLFARLCNAEADEGRRRATLALACANLPLVYTHYFGWLLVGLELCYLLAWRRRLAPRFAAWAAALALLYAPWAWAVWRAAAAGEGLAQNIGWAARPRARELFLPYLLLHEPFRFQQHTHEPAALRLSVLLALVVFAPPLCALAWRTLARGREQDVGGDEFATRFLFFFSAAPVAVTFLLAHALPHSVWGTRHLIVIAPAYLLLAAHAVANLRPGWLAACACALLGCWLLLAAALSLTRTPTQPVWCAWGTLARAAARDDDAARLDGGAAQRDEGVARRDEGVARRDDGASVSPPDRVRVYAFEDLVAYHLWHESGAGGGRAFAVSVVRGMPGVSEDRAFFLPRGFGEVSAVDAGAAFGEERFWLAFRDAAWDEERPALKYLAARGYRFGRRHEVKSRGQTAYMVLAERR